MNHQPIRPNLYQEPPGAGPEPEPRAPNLLEQVLGVFTAPVPLFRRLAVTPRWGWAMLTTLGFTLVMVLIWAARVDADALLRPILSQNPRLAREMVDQAIELHGRLLGLFGALGVLLGLPSLSLFLAFILWLAGRAAPGPDGSPSYGQALSAAVVPGLVSLPKALLISGLCLLRPVRGLMPDALSPLSLGAWRGPGHGKLHALLTGFDLFMVAHLVLLFLAARHLLGLRVGAALPGTAAGAAVIAGLVVFNG